MKVLLYEKMHRTGVEMLERVAEAVIAPGTDEQSILSCVADIDAIIIRANGSVTPLIMDAAPALKVIGRHGVGVDNIEVEAATDRGIWVVNTPLANREAVAEHVVGMILHLTKRLRQADDSVRRGDWSARYRIVGTELTGKTLGVAGMGNIGSRVAEICHRGFDMRVQYFDVVRRMEVENMLEARAVELNELFATSDVVSIHLPKLSDTTHLIDENLIGLMKPSAFLINTARGGTVDDRALVAALRSGRIAGAGLDVFEDEFCEGAPAFHDLDNVVLSPHMAAHTAEALERMSLVAEDVVAVLNGHRPSHPVNELRHSQEV